MRARRVDARLPREGNLNTHGARPVHLITTMMKWIWTRRLSITNSVFVEGCALLPAKVRQKVFRPEPQTSDPQP